MVGRLDLSSPAAPVSWRTVATAADAGGASIADHWHVFAHSAHWIVFSTTGAQHSYLLKLDPSFARLALVPVSSSDGAVTNDMFMTAEPTGVAVGHFLPGVGHRIYRFATDASLRGTVNFGGGRYLHTNGASAEPAGSGFLVYAPQTLNPTTTSAVRVIAADASWEPTAIAAAIAEDGTNIAMATSVLLSSGYRIVTARVLTGTSPQGGAPQPGASDSGAVVRYVLAPNFQTVSREVIVPSGADRPHTALVGDRLVTTWDASGGAWIREDRVSP